MWFGAYPAACLVGQRRCGYGGLQRIHQYFADWFIQNGVLGCDRSLASLVATASAPTFAALLVRGTRVAQVGNALSAAAVVVVSGIAAGRAAAVGVDAGWLNQLALGGAGAAIDAYRRMAGVAATTIRIHIALGGEAQTATA